MTGPQQAPASFVNAPTPPDPPASTEGQKPASAAPKPSQGVPAGRAWYVLLPLLVVAFVAMWSASPTLAVVVLGGAVALAALGLAGHQATRRSRARARAAAQRAGTVGTRTHTTTTRPVRSGGGFPWTGRGGPTSAGGPRPSGAPRSTTPRSGGVGGVPPTGAGRSAASPRGRIGTPQRDHGGNTSRSGLRGLADRFSGGRRTGSHGPAGRTGAATSPRSTTGSNPSAGSGRSGLFGRTGRSSSSPSGARPAQTGGGTGGRPRLLGGSRSASSPSGSRSGRSGAGPLSGRTSSPSRSASGVPVRSARRPFTWFKPSDADRPRRRWDVLPNKFGGNNTVWDQRRTGRNQDEPASAGAGKRTKTNEVRADVERVLGMLPRRTAGTSPKPSRHRIPPVAQDQARRGEPGWRPWKQPKDNAESGAALFGDDNKRSPNPPTPVDPWAAPADAPLDENGFPLHPVRAADHDTGGSNETPGREQMGAAAFYAGMIENSTAETRARTKAEAAETASNVSALKSRMAEEADERALAFSQLEGYADEAVKAAAEAAQLRQDAVIHGGIAQALAEEAVAEARRFAPSS